ncbi:ssDNA-binding transcriptional regulator [Piromyces finnis]|uniref:SsDNA-binding transcriptional regulator n=1 Tax=Piromyces finnis TaxID=1754191 RepID=A0A1Y1VK84_9FUNG|nr:ssDNA-binding transcriptional regulator [Piromyces finnis]|eukprot:ORX57777.1 ssDNA-binding transcriptional regulator [Piromyces finnis]
MENKGKVGKVESNEDGSYTIQLDNKRRVQVSNFKNMTFVDIREFYKNSNNEYRPSKKGISLTMDAWKQLKESIVEIDHCIEELKTKN